MNRVSSLLIAVPLTLGVAYGGEYIAGRYTYSIFPKESVCSPKTREKAKELFFHDYFLLKGVEDGLDNFYRANCR